MKNRISGLATACSVAALIGVAGAAQALDIVMINSNAAAQSDQRTKAGFEAWIETNGKTDWNVSFLDSGGSGEATASNIQDAASRGVDAIVVTMADLRASRAALDAAKQRTSRSSRSTRAMSTASSPTSPPTTGPCPRTCRSICSTRWAARAT